LRRYQLGPLSADNLESLIRSRSAVQNRSLFLEEDLMPRVSEELYTWAHSRTRWA